MPNKHEKRVAHKPEIRSIATELRVTKDVDGTRTVTGRIPYGVESEDLGGFTEVIAQGAFSDALDPKADVLALRDHDPKLLLGRTKSKTLTLTDSPEELRYAVKMPNTTAANDLAESIERGDLDATSFGFAVEEDKWTVTADKVVRSLIKVELLEVSPCSFPAYPSASVDIRSIPAEIRSRISFHTRDGNCDCSCPECEDGYCADCSDPDCDDPNCLHADDPKPEHDDPEIDETDSLRSYMHMAIAVKQRS